MHGGAAVVGKQKPKAVVIAHLRLDSELAKPNAARENQRAARMEKAGDVDWLVEDIRSGKEAAKGSAQAKRIKIINAFLGSNENALAQIRLRGSPMALLIEKASAKGEELMAAQEIETAWMAISGALMFKPLSLERTSRGQFPDWSDRTAKAVEQYQSWAGHWSKRKVLHLDHTLECVIAAVIDQRPIRAIGEDLGFGREKIERAVLGGLRDYAARAGWVDGKIAQQWMDAAEQTFKRSAAA